MDEKSNTARARKGNKENYRKAEEPSPQLCLPVIEELRLSLEQSREEVAMPVLILTPVLKVLEDGIDLELRVGLQMPVDGDVPPVSNLFGEVRCVEDELRLEECVLPSLGQEPQIKCQVEV